MSVTNGASLMCCLREVGDPRKPSNGTLHDFLEILVIAIAAALSDCDTVEDVAYWARTKETWLWKFLALKNSVPSEETFLRVFRALDPKQFESAFRRWVAGIVGALRARALRLMARRCAGPAVLARPPSTWSAPSRQTWGLFSGRRRSPARATRAPPKVVTSGLAVKGNQATLLAAIETTLIDQRESHRGTTATATSTSRMAELSARSPQCCPALGIVDLTDGPGCNTIGGIDSLRQVGDKESPLERRYYISSRALSADNSRQPSVRTGT
jgi:hypothetical protein